RRASPIPVRSLTGATLPRVFRARPATKAWAGCRRWWCRTCSAPLAGRKGLGARLALGDLLGAHAAGQGIAQLGREGVAAARGDVEPLVGLDPVLGNTFADGVHEAELDLRGDVAGKRVLGEHRVGAVEVEPAQGLEPVVERLGDGARRHGHRDYCAQDSHVFPLALAPAT